MKTLKMTMAMMMVVVGLVFSSVNGHAAELKVHGIFGSNMVLQREKPIKVWGWAPKRQQVSVTFGAESTKTKAEGDDGRWEVTFPAQKANSQAQKLVVTSGDKTIEMVNIVIGDVWVMNGQSNMAFGLYKTTQGDLESVQAHLPLLRRVGINPNESETPQSDIRKESLSNGGWVAASPQTAGGFSSIGYSFGARLQRALQIPIGIIDNARGGASIESLVPLHKFDDHPVAAAYKAHLDKRIAEFDPSAAVQRLIDKWQKQIADKRAKGVPADKLPPKPTAKSLRSWNVPGKSPSDAASCYNGMFGVFKGLNIKGVLFHQGYNNASALNCRPKRYRVLVKLMVEGWREDFNDPKLPVGIIGFCAGSISQTPDNFEHWSSSPASYIREAQRLGLTDLEDPSNTAFLPAYDIQVPGLHPGKKQAHAIRAARWALSKIYGMRVNWGTASLVSAEPDGDRMVLTFDAPVFPDDRSIYLEGFSIADKSGKFYMAYAENHITKYQGIWGNKCDYKKIYVSSPLVKEPVAVRYAWATSPMGNLKVNGMDYLPLHSFRTDNWDWPEAGPETNMVDRPKARQMAAECAERFEYRKKEEARRAVEINEARRKRDAELAKRDGWRE